MPNIQKSTALLIIITFVFQGFQTYCQNNVGGSITGNIVWKKMNSPYTVISDITVTSGSTLTIEPGVEVRFTGNTCMNIHGELLAKGNLSDTILMVPDSVGKIWRGIVIGDYSSITSSKITLTFVRATTTEYSFIFIYPNVATDTLVRLRNSVFTDHYDIIRQSSLVKPFRISVDSCFFMNFQSIIKGPNNYRVTNSRFQNGTSGFNSAISEKSLVDRCTFDDVTGPLCVAGTVLNCKFSNCNSAIVLSPHGTTATVNDIQNNTTGIYGFGKISNCLITKNIINNNTVGISFQLADTVIISYNEIKNNTVGVSIEDTIKWSNIHHNIICENTGQFRNQGPSKIIAPNNCWCVSDSSAVRYLVRGNIDFTPIDKYCSDSGPLSLKENEDEDIFSVFPNPATDVLQLRTKHYIVGEILIYDIHGILVERSPMIPATRGIADFRFDVSHLIPGIYFIYIKKGFNKVPSVKFVKM
jgi:hypothetical protein